MFPFALAAPVKAAASTPLSLQGRETRLNPVRGSIWSRLRTISIAALLATSLLVAKDAEFIYTKAPFPSAHASTVVELKNGDILSAWFGGSAESKPDVAIWGARRTSSGWSQPFELVREPSIACYNPVLFYTKDGRLWLYYKFGPDPVSWTAGRMVSTDDGQTWSKPEHLPAGLIGPVRAKPLVLADGTIVSGSSVESYHSWAVWVERSTDQGMHWTKFGPIAVAGQAQTDTPEKTSKYPFDWNLTAGIIQPSVVPMGGKHLRIYARSTAKTGKICVADSTDNGVTWTQARPIDVPNPNSGIDAVATGDGRVALIYNNTPKGRTPLNLAISKDGEHFTMFDTLESEPGEYSYPAMVLAKNGDLLITYTWKRERIKFVRVPKSELPK